MRKAGLVVFAMMIVGVFFLFVGCKGDDFGHNDDGVNNNAVSVYQGIVLEMKKDIKTYRDAADLGEPTADEAYYARITDHLDRLGALRDQMGGECGGDHMDSGMMSDDDCISEGSEMMNMMMQMMDLEQGCHEELDNFMELCLNEDVEHDGHMDHVFDHAENMGDILDDMVEHCDEMMSRMDDDDDHDHGGGHLGGGHMGGGHMV